MEVRSPTPDPPPRGIDEGARKIARAKAQVQGWVKEWVGEVSKTKGKEAAEKEVTDAVSQDFMAREL
eukprot:8329968-Karenia_brevis.AAC.1